MFHGNDCPTEIIYATIDVDDTGAAFWGVRLKSGAYRMTMINRTYAGNFLSSGIWDFCYHEERWTGSNISSIPSGSVNTIGTDGMTFARFVPNSQIEIVVVPHTSFVSIDKTFGELERSNKILHETVKDLRQTIQDLQQKMEEIYFAPGMPGYRETKVNWQSLTASSNASNKTEPPLQPCVENR
jgi:hypothetical protein